MRLLPFMVLLLVVGGVAYVFINPDTREWVLGKAKDAKHAAQGYTSARTPREAMEKFADAVKNRNYTAAAIYVSQDYAKLLEKGADAAGAVGAQIDKATRIAEDKGFVTDKFTAIMRALDPFPAPLKIVNVKHKEGESKAVGVFAADYRLLPVPVHEMTELDGQVLQNCLAPAGLYRGAKIEIRKDADDVWRMQIPIPNEQHNAVIYYNDKHKSYVTGLKQFSDDLMRGRWLKDQIVPELLSTLRASK